MIVSFVQMLFGAWLGSVDFDMARFISDLFVLLNASALVVDNKKHCCSQTSFKTGHMFSINSNEISFIMKSVTNM